MSGRFAFTPAFPNGSAGSWGADAHLRSRRREVSQLEGLAADPALAYPGIEADLADARRRLAEAEAG